MSGKNQQSLSGEHTAVVLGLFDTGLAVVRSLGRNGIMVAGMDNDPHMPGFRSRYCISKIFPNPVYRPGETVEFLLREAKDFVHEGILFPTTDAFVLFISRHREELKDRYRFILPPSGVVESIVNKRTQYELARKSGTEVPATWFPSGINDVQNIKNSVRYPVIVKGCDSYKWREKYPRIKGYRVRSPHELVSVCREVISAGIEFLVQSIIPGPNTNHYKVCVYVNGGGQMLAVFMLQKIRQYPADFGVGTCVKSIEIDELKEIGTRFFQRIGYRGVGSAEFKRDEQDGRFKLIELNPRYWQQNGLADACGINFPLIQYLDLTRQKIPSVETFRKDLKWLDIASDFQSYWSHQGSGHLTLGEWLRSLRHVKVFSTLALDDPGPFLKDMEYGLKIAKLPLYLLR